MIEELDIDTYLYISKNKLQIFVYNKKDQKNLYTQEKIVYDEYNFQDLNELSKFLDENIYKIEKLVGNFVKDIILVVENDENLNVSISIKKKNYNETISKKDLESSLTELKDLFNENYQEQNILHMIIVNYIIDEISYSSFVGDLSSDYLCLEVKFVCITNDLIFKFDKLLTNYQITISKYMCGNYVNNFSKIVNGELTEKIYKLKNGFNDNEVTLVPKNVKNRGFFEKFFQLFS